MRVMVFAKGVEDGGMDGPTTPEMLEAFAAMDAFTEELVKAGVFGILKVAIYVFGLDFLSTIALRPAVLYVAGFTVIAASLIALMKTDLKARLAYSTIAQLSYVVMGAMLATSAGIVGGALQLVTHGMAKITLFMCAGSVIVATGRTDVSEMSGLGKQMPWTFAAFFIASFSLIGLPPFGGFMSKWELLRAGAEAHEPVMVLVLILSTLLSAAYLLPVCASAFFGPVYEAPPKGKRRTSVISENIVCVIPLCLSAAGCAVLFCLSDAIYNFLKPILP